MVKAYKVGVVEFVFAPLIAVISGVTTLGPILYYGSNQTADLSGTSATLPAGLTCVVMTTDGTNVTGYDGGNYLVNRWYFTTGS